jgi:hypothetical protein
MGHPATVAPLFYHRLLENRTENVTLAHCLMERYQISTHKDSGIANDPKIGVPNRAMTGTL